MERREGHRIFRILQEDGNLNIFAGGMKRVILVSAAVIGGFSQAAKADGFIKDAEPTVVEVRYERTEVLDTTRRNSDAHKFRDRTLLRIGTGKSVFCCAQRLWRDSIMAVDPATYWEMERLSMEKDPKAHGATALERSGTYSSYIYKNYPEGKLTERAYFGMEGRGYEEAWEKPEWSISEETKEISGYQCLKATTKYRGREWEAWFAPEIPIPDGPWKLCGLPGLILEAYDTHKDYCFTATSIFKNPESQVGYFAYNDRMGIHITSRDKFFNAWWRYANSNFGGAMSAMYGKGPQTGKKTRNVPNRDKEETDYPHDL